MHLARQDPQDEDLRIQMVSATEPMQHAGDPLEDVFGSDSESPMLGWEDRLEARESHPSDVRRLQSEHATAGYREGITAAKAISIQKGFDEGFSLGATVGLKAGQLLGFLEGLTSALRADDENHSRQALQLFEGAGRELSTESIFSEQYWASDGTWKYEVHSASNDSEIIFEDVANAHPMISKWSSLVDAQLGRWSVNRDVLELAKEASSGIIPEKKEVKIEQQPREVLDW
ncbi:essential protein Yae1 [Xylariales sp. AK1849]|nr:essential protein Yae1 [Xylariales sp. AK1849]